MHETYVVHTWKCSVVGCSEQLTLYGEQTSPDDRGWHHEIIFGEEWDFCPTHFEKLTAFLCGKTQ